MATKSAQPEAEKADIEELLDYVDKTLDRTKVLYEQYFLGMQKQPPTQIHTDVERRLRELQQVNIRNTGLRYRFATIQQKFGSYNSYWRRTVRQIENGTYIRNLQKISRQSALTGEEIPEEILAAMPKRMRDQVKRDREQALAIARRRQDATVNDGGYAEEVDDDSAAIIGETPELLRQLPPRRGAAHVLDASDGELDIDAFFASVTDEGRADDTQENVPVFAEKPAPVAPAPRAATAPIQVAEAQPVRPAAPAGPSYPRPGTPPPTPPQRGMAPPPPTPPQRGTGPVPALGASVARPATSPGAGVPASATGSVPAVPGAPAPSPATGPVPSLPGSTTGAVPVVPGAPAQRAATVGGVAPSRATGPVPSLGGVPPSGATGSGPAVPGAPAQRAATVGGVAPSRATGPVPIVVGIPPAGSVPTVPGAPAQRAATAYGAAPSRATGPIPSLGGVPPTGATGSIPAVPAIPSQRATGAIPTVPSQRATGAIPTMGATGGIPTMGVTGSIPIDPSPRTTGSIPTDPSQRTTGVIPTQRATGPIPVIVSSGESGQMPTQTSSIPTMKSGSLPAVPRPIGPGAIPRPGGAPAPSQVSKPNPIAPGASSARPAVPVETMAGPFPRAAPPPVHARQEAPKVAPPKPQPAAPRPPPGMNDADVNALYAKYVKAKQAVGEEAGPGSYGKLLQTINAQAPKIMEQYKAKGVEFSVVVKDNQVVIKAKPKT